jgi:hypothetical protein
MLDQSQDNTAARWHERARAVRPAALALINGALVPSQSGETFECMFPIDGRFDKYTELKTTWIDLT